MVGKKLIAVAVAGVLSALAAPMATAATIDTRTSAAFAADPMLALERSRSSIVERLVAEYRSDLASNGIAEAAFREALMSLRIDRLLAASLSNSLKDVSAVVASPTFESSAASRYVAVAPTSTLAALPEADAYLVRSGESLSVVKAAQLQLTADTQLVGYFAAAPAGGSATIITPKDGPGSGPNSWIGYTAGNNVASGNGSAVAAGTFNAATNQNAAVFAGQSNVASGISSLVIGGFDNQATAIDSLVGAGAGHRATGARSVIVGGGYNLASGQWSFIGGGGRQTGSGVAGANPEDNVASGNFTAIAGGKGNRATGNNSAILGGTFHTASGSASFIGGGNNGVVGEGNTASGNNSSVLGGFLNIASGGSSAVLGGSNNTASGSGSVAMGRFAKTETEAPVTTHSGALVFSDGSAGNFRSVGANTFNVLATGGTRFVAAATNVAGEASATQTVNITPAGELTFPEEGRQQIRIRNASSLQQGMGGQSNALYLRTNTAIGFYAGGVHSDSFMDPGAGGAVLATLQSGASSTTVTGTFRALAFTATSDRNQKTGFVAADPKAILAKVTQLPVSTWSYKIEADKGIRHIGPTAQDFKAAFNVGYDDKSIATVDADGVALAAIKGLYLEVQERDARINAQLQRIASLEQQVGELAAAQVQVQDLAITVLKLQQELASLRPAREVALAK